MRQNNENTHKWLVTILCFAMLVLLVSCVTYVPAPDLTQRLSAKQARNTLINRLKKNGYVIAGTFTTYDITGVRVTPTKLVVANESGHDRIIQFNSIRNIATESDQIIILDGKRMLGVYKAHDIVDAIYVLQQYSINADEYEVSFAASLADYRKKAVSNAALPEEANRYKVQAEGAVRDKEFDDAADFYAEALKIAPWWPVGHFNRALVLGEAGEYGEAKREMKYYLQLVPEAPNARAAQDKIYDWERLESK